MATASYVPHTTLADIRRVSNPEPEVTDVLIDEFHAAGIYLPDERHADFAVETANAIRERLQTEATKRRNELRYEDPSWPYRNV